MLGGKQSFRIDHLAIAAGEKNGRSVCALLQHYFGFTPNYAPGLIGDEESKMWTVDMCRDDVQIAVMESVLGTAVTSQIRFYESGRRHASMTVQHIAIECQDISELTSSLHKNGIRFLTEDERGYPKILASKSGDGAILQVFTYPLSNGIFLEFKQRVNPESEAFKEFQDENVRGLWYHVRRKMEDIGEDAFFRLNVFGEIDTLAASLCRRGTTHFLGKYLFLPVSEDSL
jgi:4-hydroxyphenylpyruvate dioxygenase-like putative hemolysin